jgi:hypothetical protein
MKILVVVPLLVAIPMVVPPFSYKTRLGFEFDFGLIGPSFLTCSSSSSELSLVEFGGSAPPHLLEVCSAHNDKVEIKCMGSVGEKTRT